MARAAKTTPEGSGCYVTDEISLFHFLTPLCRDYAEFNEGSIMERIKRLKDVENWRRKGEAEKKNEKQENHIKMLLDILFFNLVLTENITAQRQKVNELHVESEVMTDDNYKVFASGVIIIFL